MGKKRYLCVNVLDAARERIRLTFDSVERVYVPLARISPRLIAAVKKIGKVE